MKGKMKRFLSLMLAIVLVVGTVPMDAYASSETDIISENTENEGSGNSEEATCSNLDGCADGKHNPKCALYVGPTCAGLEGCADGKHNSKCELYEGPTCAKLEGCADGQHDSECELYVKPIEMEQNSVKVEGTKTALESEPEVVAEVENVAKVGETGYATLEEAFDAAAEGDTIVLLDDATPTLKSQSAITKAAVIDLGGKTLTLTEDDLYFGTTTFKNGTIVVDSSVRPSTAVFWMFENQTLTFDGVKIVATGVTGTYLIGLEGSNSNLNLLNGSEILVENTTALDLDIICVNGFDGNDIVIENSKVNVTNLDGRVFFRGNYTVSGNSDIDLSSITKAGFRIEAGQTLSIEGTATVNIVGEPRDGGIHLTDETATYTVADTAKVNATLNKPAVAAEVNGVKYETLQAAITAVQEYSGEVTIKLLSDITENVTISEKVDLDLTIDGDEKTMNGKVTINPLSDTNKNRRITISNVNFVNTAETGVDFITATVTNHYPQFSVLNCSFTGNGKATDVAVRTKSSYGLDIKDCTGTGLHSFLQNTAGWNITIENVTVTGSKSGLAMGTVQGATVKGCNIAVAEYGIRFDAEYDNDATVENCTVNAFIPVVVRKASVDSNFKFDGTNTMTATNTDGYWFAAGTSEYEENGKLPTATTGNVKVVINDTGLNNNALYGNYVTAVAKVNDTNYETFEEAITVANAGDTITLLKDVKLTETITLPAGITFNGNGKQIDGTIYAGGDLKFEGHTKVTSFSASYYNRTITIGEGACLEVTGTGRVTLGYGNTFNVTGTIADAKTADKSTVQPSLIIPGGMSITGGNDATLNVTNAYVKIGSTTSKNSAANGKFTLNFTNSIAEFTNQLTFAEPISGKNPTFVVNFKDSVFTTGAKFIVAAPNSTVVVDNSVVTLATYFRNSGEFTLKNGSVFTGSMIQFGENGGNDGTTIVDGSTFTINNTSASHAMDGKEKNGKLVLRNNAAANINYMKDMQVEIEVNGNATSRLKTTKFDNTSIVVDATKWNKNGTPVVVEGDVSVVEAGLVTVKGAIANTDANKIILEKAPVAKVGETTYTSLQDALKAITSGCTVEILSDITIAENWDARSTGGKITVPVTIDGNGHTLKFTNTVDDKNYFAVFRFEADAKVKNLTFDLSEAVGAVNRFRAISAKSNLTVDKCTFIGNPAVTNTRAIIFGEGAGSEISNVEISVTNSTFENWRRGLTDNENAKDVKSVTAKDNTFTNANVYVSAVEEVTFTENTMYSAWVNITSYSATNQLKVTAKDNILEANGANYNYINAAKVEAQKGFLLPVAEANGKKYVTLQSAINAGGTVTLLADVELAESVNVAGTVVLDLNGHEITGTDNAAGSFGLITNKGELTITGNGKMTVKATNNRGWSAYSSVISNTVGGKLIVENGIIEHLGGTDMAYGIDNLTNGTGTYAETVINGGKVISTYRAIRQFLNGVEAQNILTVNGGTIKGTNKSIWMQDPSTKANTGTLIVGEDAKLIGDVYLSVTEGSTTWPVEVSINSDALFDEIVTSNVPDGYEIEKANGVFAVKQGVAKVGDTVCVTLEDAIKAANAGDTIELLADIEATEAFEIGKSLTINGNGHKVTSSATRVFRVTTSNVDVTLNNVNMVSKTVLQYPNDIRGISVDPSLTNVKLTLNNCSLDFTDASACDWAYAVNVSGNGTGHTVTVNGGTYEGANVINVHGANNTIVVKDATLNSLYPNNDMYYGSCIWVLQKQGSAVEATGNTFNGNNAIAFNLGTGTELTESNNTDNTKVVIAKVGDTYYTSLADAFEAAKDDKTVKVLQNVALSESVKANGKVTLDLNGKTITGTDNETKSFGLIEIQSDAELTINDTVGTGKITLESTNDRDWNAYSSVISNQRGKLTVNGGTIEHLGGTDMAYAIDNLTNGKGTRAETVINGGTIKSTYRAIRQFLNGTEAQNILTVNGGTIEGGKNSIWMQDPSKNANTGSLTVGKNATLKGDVYLSVTEGSTEWPVDVEIAAEALNGESEVAVNNVPLGYELVENNGVYGIIYERTLAGAGTEANPYLINNVDDLIFFRDSVNAGKTKFNAPGVYVALAADIDLAGTTWTKGIGDGITATFDGNFDGKDHTIKNFTEMPYADADGYLCGGLFGYIYGAATIKNLVLENVTIDCSTIAGVSHNVGALVGFANNNGGKANISNITVKGDVKIDAPNTYGVGAIVGYSYGNMGTIANCKVEANAGSYIKGYSFVGGITGYSFSEAVIDNCSVKNIGIIATSCDAGGIAGLVNNNTTIINCTVDSSVTVEGQDTVGYVVGAIGGEGNTVVIDNCAAKDPMIGGNYKDKKVFTVKVDNKYYTTLAEAINNADAGDTIELLADIEATEVILIDKSLNINGNGHKVTSCATRVLRLTTSNTDVTLNDVNMVSNAERVGTNDIRGISVDASLSNVSLTLNNCSVDFTDASACDWAYAVNVSGNGTGHTVTVNGGTYEGANVINVHGAKNTIVVKDATLNCLYPNNDMYAGACIWVLQNQNSAVEATGNTFNGNNAIAFNLGTGTALTENNNTDNTKVVAAKIGDVYYTSLKDAFAAAQNGDTVKLINNVTIDSETYTIEDGVNITFDMNGKKLTVTDNKAANVCYELFYIYGGMTVTGNGTIELTSTSNDTAWAKSSTIFHNRGGELTIEDGTYKHLGGTCMSFVIDNSGNYYGDATTNVENGTLTSSYIAIRNRMEQNSHGASGKATLNINGGTISGVSRAIWAQASSSSTTSPATGEINVTGGTIGLIDTARSAGAVSMTTITGGTVAAFKGEVRELTVKGDGTITGDIAILTADGKATAYVVNGEGVYVQAVVAVNGVGFETLAAAIAAAKAGDIVTVIDDIEIATPITVPAGKTVTLDLNGKTVAYTTDINDADMIRNSGDLTIIDSSDAENGKLVFDYTGVANERSTSTIVNLPGSTLTVKAGTVENASAANGSYNYAIDSQTNGTLGTVTVNVEGGTVKSNYMAIRQFNNGEACANTLNVTGGTIEATKRAIQVHLNNNGAYTNISDGVIKGGDYSLCFLTTSVNLSVTGGKFEGAVWYSGTDGFISGGTFDEPVSAEYCAEGYIPTTNTDGTYGVKEGEFVALNNNTSVEYATVEEALAIANSGETVILGKNATEVGVLAVTNGITLDLNGNTLSANYVVAFGDADIVDNSANKTGVLKVDDNMFSIAADNAQMPVYDGDNGGYRFATMGMKQVKIDSVDSDSFKLRFKPSFGDEIAKLLADGAADNQVNIMINLSWTNSDGTLGSQEFIYPEDLIRNVYCDGSKNAFSFSCKGLGAMGLANKVKVRFSVVSNRGVHATSEEIDPWNK